MPRRIDWLLMETNTCIQLNNPTKTLPKIGDDSINVDIIGMVKAHLQSSTNNSTIALGEGIPIGEFTIEMQHKVEYLQSKCNRF